MTSAGSGAAASRACAGTAIADGHDDRDQGEGGEHHGGEPAAWGGTIRSATVDIPCTSHGTATTRAIARVCLAW